MSIIAVVFAALSSFAEKQLKLPVVATAQISGTGNSAEPMGERS